MNIDSVETLCSELSKLEDPEAIKKILLPYGNQRETRGFEHGWLRCQSVYQKAMAQRRMTIKRFVPNYEPDGTITLNTFNKIFFNIIDELRDVGYGKYPIKDFQDFLFAVVGDLKIDRRLCFKKE